MKIADFLGPRRCRARPRYFRQATSAEVSRRRGADALGAEAAILAALGGREELGSTGIGRGIAIPHCSPKGLSRPFALPIDFDASGEAPVDVVFLLLSPEDRLLSSVARQLRTASVVEGNRRASSAPAAYAAVISAPIHR